MRGIRFKNGRFLLSYKSITNPSNALAINFHFCLRISTIPQCYKSELPGLIILSSDGSFSIELQLQHDQSEHLFKEVAIILKVVVENIKILLLCIKHMHTTVIRTNNQKASVCVFTQKHTIVRILPMATENIFHNGDSLIRI